MMLIKKGKKEGEEQINLQLNAINKQKPKFIAVHNVFFNLNRKTNETKILF